MQRALGAALVVFLYASTAAAHHSFVAEYDAKMLTTLSGIGIADGDWATDARIAQQAVEAIGASHGE